MLNNSRDRYIVKTIGQKLFTAAQKDPTFTIPESDPSTILVLNNEIGMLLIVSRLREADPTKSKKYLLWIVKQYINGQFKHEDIPRLNADITTFIKFRKSIENKDLNSYKNLPELYAVIDKDKDDTISSRQLKKLIKHEGARYIIDTPNFKVVSILTAQAALYYAMGTRWCTNDAKQFNNYINMSELYVIMIKDEFSHVRKFQLHYHSGQVMDETDQPITKRHKEMLSEYPQWAEFLNYLIDKHYKFIPPPETPLLTSLIENV